MPTGNRSFNNASALCVLKSNRIAVMQFCPLSAQPPSLSLPTPRERAVAIALSDGASHDASARVAVSSILIGRRRFEPRCCHRRRVVMRTVREPFLSVPLVYAIRLRLQVFLTHQTRDFFRTAPNTLACATCTSRRNALVAVVLCEGPSRCL